MRTTERIASEVVSAARLARRFYRNPSRGIEWLNSAMHDPPRFAQSGWGQTSVVRGNECIQRLAQGLKMSPSAIRGMPWGCPRNSRGQPQEAANVTNTTLELTPATTTECPHCQSTEGQWRGYRTTRRSVQRRRWCKCCGRWFIGHKQSVPRSEGECHT